MRTAAGSPSRQHNGDHHHRQHSQDLQHAALDRHHAAAAQRSSAKHTPSADLGWLPGWMAGRLRELRELTAAKAVKHQQEGAPGPVPSFNDVVEAERAHYDRTVSMCPCQWCCSVQSMVCMTSRCASDCMR